MLGVVRGPVVRAAVGGHPLLRLSACLAHQLRKDSFGGAGMSRSSVQPPAVPGSQLIARSLPATARPSGRAFSASAMRLPEDITKDAPFIMRSISDGACGRRRVRAGAAAAPSSERSPCWVRTSSSRRCTRISGMLIFTGHTS